MWCSTASTTTMASSTTRPMASTRPKSDSVLIENPSSGKTMNVPTRDTGTASSGISVARKPCRKTKTTMMTRTRASNSVLTISSMPAAHGQRRVERRHVVEVGREARLDLLHQLRRRRCMVSMAFEPGSW